MKRSFRPMGSAEEAGSTKSFWSLQFDKNSSEFICKSIWNALSLASRGRRIYGIPPLPLTSDFRLACLGIWIVSFCFCVLDCGFVVLCFVPLGSVGLSRLPQIDPDSAR